MPRARVHQRVGRPVGPAYAVLQASRSQHGDVLIEAIAGGLEGDLGARCPDWLEPGCWHHRRTSTPHLDRSDAHRSDRDHPVMG